MHPGEAVQESLHRRLVNQLAASRTIYKTTREAGLVCTDLPGGPRAVLHHGASQERDRLPGNKSVSSWEPCSQMIPCSTTKKIRSDCPKSAPKFALMLKILSMIYKMVQSNTYATKRDIYYTDTLLFGSQSVVDNIIDDISCMLKIPRRSLHIAVTVPSNVEGIKNLISHAKFMLIVEKDATFQRLLDDDFCNKLTPCIMITGRGVPDLNTRLLVRKLWDTFQIPIFTLMDADPHGIEIMCIYKYGSVSMSFEAHHLTVPSIKWLGLLPSDLERLNICKDALIPLTKQDQNKLASIQKRPYIAHQPMWKRELEIMAASKMKAEIQVLTSLSSDYLSRVYLPNKLQFGGWI
nr:meiotic recombination protein SPO11 isoform X5 [Dromaius novaehollandiae]XP_025957684.1 meiotic recombination protein SPO11 isoform X5 [Dromaius novaehollandiae]XP_025957685.1 meiotic recombination protein SPO11 isoform X5 [Dromaius novaehollandiae]XP_025957687.1 meiotic recombination protein SPO11 isoform X5 [Dromaius novaehollandiae]XP_025957688.1 meiotic recombination protein SPO11 isoform X5 [Dromaius novaehollandiae]